LDSTPCLFKLGSAFYDFTPFKLAANLWPTGVTNKADLSLEHLQYNFTWCQLIADTVNVTDSAQEMACNGDFFAGSAPVNIVTRTVGTCTPLSGGSGKDNVEAATILNTVSYTDENGLP